MRVGLAALLYFNIAAFLRIETPGRFSSIIARASLSFECDLIHLSST
jgi:hypothetical protein